MENLDFIDYGIFRIEPTESALLSQNKLSTIFSVHALYV